MKLKIVNTSDNSDTLYCSKFDEHYHSIYGAFGESMHVFIETGLHFCQLNTIKIFEVGFGTGLNAILSYIEGIKRNLTIEYTTIELYPIDKSIIEQLNFSNYLSDNSRNTLNILHDSKWEETIQVSKNFSFKKIESDFTKFTFPEKFDIVYFDAFAPEKQPEMWSAENFSKIYETLNLKGILTTYSSKGIVKNNLRNAGFNVKRLSGPKGKHHILRAQKL